MPTVTLGGNGSTTSAAIASVSNWGNPGIFVANGDLTLGSDTNAASGKGIVIVQGNLTINVTQGFHYYGLIIATGNVTITGNLGASKTASATYCCKEQHAKPDHEPSMALKSPPSFMDIGATCNWKLGPSH